MTRTVIVLPNALGDRPDDSPFLQKLETLRTMTEFGELSRLTPIPQIETPEATWLGMKPDEAQMRQGPLTVSAFGFDPPDRSIHFHVSFLGVVDGIATAAPNVIAAEDLGVILEQAKRLNTKTLTFLQGENADHALVWEGLGDLHTDPATTIIGKQIKNHLPEGDAEKDLRRFIDDSVNLLTELELNERRIDEGLPPLNLLWPWGHGRRTAVPNLLLKRGERAHVESNSLRLAGLSRLVGYRHGDRQAFGRGTNTRLDHLVKIALKEDPAILVIDAPAELRANNQLEESHWFLKELDERLLKPLFSNAIKQKSRIAIVAPGSAEGLALEFTTGSQNANVYPFDERSLEERSLPRTDPWVFVSKALQPLDLARIQSAPR